MHTHTNISQKSQHIVFIDTQIDPGKASLTKAQECFTMHTAQE